MSRGARGCGRSGWRPRVRDRSPRDRSPRDRSCDTLDRFSVPLDRPSDRLDRVTVDRVT
jgi:hypothetical protein